jgi:isopentenyl-diphosphate delta-isomerase
MVDDLIKSRKDDHININLEQDVQSHLSSGLDGLRFIHNALPDLDLHEIDLSQSIFGRKVSLPVLISSMTGGTEKAQKINQSLAVAAEEFGLAMGVGSQRAALEDDSIIQTFKIREYAPNILLFANLGAVQLNYGYGVDDCKKAVDMIGADSLILHLNPLQEAIQPEGNTNFKGLLNKIEQVCRGLPVPVVIKEVGWGISADLAVKLVECGVSGIDVAGAGGTSWSQVERFRLENQFDKDIADAFIGWGIPTAEALIAVRERVAGIPVFASGGLKSGMDIAKTLALGADLAGMAGVFLRAVARSEDYLSETIRSIEKIIRIAMFVTGSPNLETFSQGKIQKIEKNYGY